MSKEFEVTVEGREYLVTQRQIPFSEGFELSCWVDGEEIRVSDRGLGEKEALGTLKEEIKLFINRGHTNEI